MKKLAIVLLAVLMMCPVAFGKEVGGKNIPDTITAGSETLALNGAGIRTKLFMDIYAGGLYLKSKMSDPKAIIEADEPMAIKMHVISGLMTEDKLEGAYRDGFDKATGGNVNAIKARMEKFIAAQKGEIKKDDVIDLIYVPAEGTNVFKNGRLTATIKGLDFKKAMVAIWLGEEPAHEDLKLGMLGQE